MNEQKRTQSERKRYGLTISLIKAVLLLLLTLGINSCKKDILVSPKLEHQSQVDVKTISYSEFLSSININTLGLLKSSFQKSNTKKLASIDTTNSFGNLAIYTDSLKKFVTEEGTSFVFKMQLSSPRARVFRNLTIYAHKGGKTSAFIATYTPSNQWINARRVNKLVPFEGETSFAPIDLKASNIVQGLSNVNKKQSINGNGIKQVQTICYPYTTYTYTPYGCSDGNHMPWDMSCAWNNGSVTPNDSDRVAYWAWSASTQIICEDFEVPDPPSGGGGTTPDPPGGYDPCDDPPAQNSIKKNSGFNLQALPPSPCDGNDGGGTPPNAVSTLINDLQITDESQRAYLSSNTTDATALYNYLSTNGWTSGNMEFIYWAIAYLAANPSEEVANLLANRASLYYTNAEMEAIFDSMEDPLTSDPIEFYMVLAYKNPKYFDMHRYDASSSTMVGQYYVTPYRNKAGTIVCYTASRNGYNGIEYVIKAGQLSLFSSKINDFTEAADNFYAQGKPSIGWIQTLAGDRWAGFISMWADAIKSPTWWAYAVTSFGHAIARLPNSSVGSTSTAPNWKNSMKKMVGDSFQGKVVTNPQGASVTINIPDNYVPSLSNNGQGLNFRPNPAVGTHENAGLIRIMAPTTQYPNGYAVFYNASGQPINPLNNQTLGPSNWHFEF